MSVISLGFMSGAGLLSTLLCGLLSMWAWTIVVCMVFLLFLMVSMIASAGSKSRFIV